MSKFRSSLIILFLLCSIGLTAQTTDDYGFRIGGKYKKKLNKKFGLTLKQEFRFRENASKFKKSNTTFSGEYKMKSWLRFRLNYRYTLNKRMKKRVLGQRHRLMGDIIFRKKHQKFRFSNRIRFQSEIKTVHYKNNRGFPPATALRNTIKVKYRINKKYRPHFSVDFRFSLYDRSATHTGFNRHRITAGVDISVSKKHILDPYLMINRQWNIENPKRIFIIGLNYKFKD
ncbi:MAG TPA: DUF2490 domain-containing protein [Flavobacteriaceae bacterium]|nr:DUF2490 domain-containing protein [Flavobacteriaceae bacterium]